MSKPRPMQRAGRLLHQRGVAALEFALVAMVFLIILFGIANYGAAFVVQQALTRAAEDGARAMLQARLAPAQAAQTPGQFGCAAAIRSVQWLSDYRERVASGPLTCLEPVLFDCSYDSSLQCASLVVRYSDYRSYPLIPDLVPLGAWLAAVLDNPDGWMPQDLSAGATVQLGLGAS